MLSFSLMAPSGQSSSSKLAHYRAWTAAWHISPFSDLPAEECLSICEKAGADWIRTPYHSAMQTTSQIVACFKTAAKARVVLLGGRVSPACDATDVLSESYDARVTCSCSGLYPVPDRIDIKNCGCKAIERMVAEAELVNGKEEEWNSTDLFTSEGLSLAVQELALCHGDIQPTPTSCGSELVVEAPDRRTTENDLDNDEYNALFPTEEKLRLSSDAKYFFAIAGGLSVVDPGVQMAIADSGNDILIGDYCDAASDEGIHALQQTGAAAFAFLKLCVYAGLINEWHFNQLVAQAIQFRILSYWRDHSLSHRPRGIYGSRMTGLHVHRRIDLGMVAGIVSSSIATRTTMSSRDYMDVVYTCTLINDLVDLRGDAWRNQRENVVLRGIRGNLCSYLDGLVSECIQSATDLLVRGRNFACAVFCMCNWMLLSSGHKVCEIVNQLTIENPCDWKSDGYEKLLEALEPYGTLRRGPDITVKRKDLQLLYNEYRFSSETHISWLADATRIILHPKTLRMLVDIVHCQWKGDLGDVKYCA